MRLITGTLEELRSRTAQGSTVVLGTFDGMHRGHAVLCGKAREVGGYRVLHTFLEHPRAVVTGKAVPLLSTADERICQAASMGIQEMRMMHFTREIAAMPPRKYLEYIVESLRPRHVVAGFNHTFGSRGEGDAAFLRNHARYFGYRLHVIPPCALEGTVIAAREVRRCVLEGDMEEAAKFLGRPYSMGGRIEHGRHFGSTIGFPTANIHPPDKLMPPFGVYAAYVELKSGGYEAVLNLGMRPTVQGHHMTIEAHILNFDKDIYGKYARAHLLHFLRPEKKYADITALREGIAEDTERVKAYFAGLQLPGIRDRIADVEP